jgi:GNAT superfamily N-acetyltransferase
MVLLVRLAGDRAYQGHGIGVGMLQDAIRRTLLIAEQAGIRALSAHPSDADADAFYRRFGFVSLPVCEGRTLRTEQCRQKPEESRIFL